MTSGSSGIILIASKRKGGTPVVRGNSIIDVDRTNPVLGNPYVLHDHNNEDERHRVIAAYERDFRAEMGAGGSKLQAVQAIAHRLRDGERIALRCWCAPRRCHAEIIRATAYEIAGMTAPPLAKEQEQTSLF